MSQEKTYFVSYNYTDQFGIPGFGNVDVTMSNTIKTMSSVREIEARLCVENNFKFLVIINYIEL